MIWLTILRRITRDLRLRKIRSDTAALSMRYAAMLAMAEASRAKSILSIGISFGLPEIVACRDLGVRVIGTDYRDEKTDIWAAAAAEYGVQVVAYDAVRESAARLASYGPFDMIWCCEVLEHLRLPPDLIVGELCQLLSPGGQLLLTVPNVGGYSNLRRLLKGENFIEPLRPVTRPDIEAGRSVFDGWIHVREPSINEMARLLRDGTPSEMSWDVWLPSEPIVWRGSNIRGILGGALQRSFKRLRGTIYCLGSRPGSTGE